MKTPRFKIFVLIVVECGDGAELGEGGGIGSGVALDGVDRISDGLGRGGVAKAPAGHGVGLAETVDGICSILPC